MMKVYSEPMKPFRYFRIREEIIFRDREEKRELLAKELNMKKEEILEVIVASNCIYIETNSEIIRIFPDAILHEAK